MEYICSMQMSVIAGIAIRKEKDWRLKTEGAATSIPAEQPSDGQAAVLYLDIHYSYLNSEFSR